MSFSFKPGLCMVKKKKTKETKAKKSKKSVSKPKKSTQKKKKSKAQDTSSEDMGIVVIEDDLKVDKEAELEARKAYLEEAKSQEAFD